MRLVLGFATSVVLLAVLSSAASAELDGDEFESPAWRVSMTAPRGWQLSERSSYPNVLLWMSRRAPKGKMLFSAERLAGTISAVEYARRTSARLVTLGFRVHPPQLHSATGAYWVDLESERSFLRQAFLVSGDIGYTLTVSADDSRSRSQHVRAFDSALRSIRVLKPTPPGAPAPAEVDPAAAPAPGATPGTTPGATPGETAP